MNKIDEELTKAVQGLDMVRSDLAQAWKAAKDVDRIVLTAMIGDVGRLESRAQELLDAWGRDNDGK